MPPAILQMAGVLVSAILSKSKGLVRTPKEEAGWRAVGAGVSGRHSPASRTVAEWGLPFQEPAFQGQK